MSNQERKLAAIVFTDIVGFTELSAKNEPAAQAPLHFICSGYGGSLFLFIQIFDSFQGGVFGFQIFQQ